MPQRRTRENVLTEAAFARLLARLDPDPDRAAVEYERLRRALVRFFDWRGAWPPDECADMTLDRLARKLDEAVVQDVRSYAHGIARLLLLERRRQPQFAPLTSATEIPSADSHSTSLGDDSLRDCFDKCLSNLPPESRTLMLDYYEGRGADRISRRRALAAARGLSDSALRSRVQRLRDRLEHCVDECRSIFGKDTR